VPQNKSPNGFCGLGRLAMFDSYCSYALDFLGSANSYRRSCPFSRFEILKYRFINMLASALIPNLSSQF
jgi:hypothetical protein